MRDIFKVISATVHFKEAEDLHLKTGCVLSLNKESKQIELYPFGVNGKDLAEMFVSLVDQSNYTEGAR